MSVKLRYVELPANRIFNWLNPMNVTCWNAYPTWIPTWWDSQTVGLREEFGRIWTTEFDKITGHFTELEKSIAISGIKRPISVVSGHFRNMMLSMFFFFFFNLAITSCTRTLSSNTRRCALKIFPCSTPIS